MPLVTDITQRQTALTPYAANRRRKAKDERRRDREQRKESPPRQVSGIRCSAGPNSEVAHLDQTEANDALMKVEAGLKTDPNTARESQMPDPKIVRSTLRG